ncbi:MAG: DUF427 domain-containing protein [Streptosporangiales bacterium]|nr:DUF427 domain-containing protein [Streptosporangiales bacterium]
MSLTLPPGPLSGTPGDTNYRIDGPKHRLFVHDFPRRVRAVFGGATVLDTEQGKLVHETGLLPVLYAPLEDFDRSLLQPTDHTTHCPFKGDASYWSVNANGSVAENAVWAYEAPKPESAWLKGYAALYFEAMDAWYDEEERIDGHLRDPYHRVDIVPSARHVEVRVGEQVLAVTDRPLVVSETALPNRFYLPLDDVRQDLLGGSDTRTVCPYKGTATYRSLDDTPDLAWLYEGPLPPSAALAGHICFDPDKVVLTVE